MKIRALLLFSCSLEMATGVAVIFAPSFFARILLSSELGPGGEAIARVGGFGLFSLAIACWPRGKGEYTQAVRALFFYNLVAACYLAYLRIGSEFSSFLLVPVSVLHGLVALLFARPAYKSVVDRDSNLA